MIKTVQKIISIFVLTAFITTSGQMPTYASTFATEGTGNTAPSYAPIASAGALNLPQPGTMVSLSPAYVPVLIKGLRVHPDNPLLFDFIVDSGNSGLDINSSEFKTESNKLIKYFLAALTIKEDDLWVNLSPYEKDRMIPQELGQTEMGRDLLAQDYILKQLTASLIYPGKQLGKEFWNRVYSKAQAEYGTTQIPINTFNKVWIVAEKAKIAENGDTAFVTGGHLKVMLEEDYLSLQRHNGVIPSEAKQLHTLSSNIVRQIILPEIENEVNQGKNFSPLRQMFYSMILASWYKSAIKNALLNQVFTDRKMVGGLAVLDQLKVKDIYAKYLQAYKKGVFNFIKEDRDLLTAHTIPRKYFSGGVVVYSTPAITKLTRSSGIIPIQPVGNLAMLTTQMLQRKVSKDNAMSKQRRLLILLSTVVVAGAMAIWVNKNGYKLRLNAIPGYATYMHLTTGTPVEDVPFLELVGDLQRAVTSNNSNEIKYYLQRADDYQKNTLFKNESDKKLFLSAYWPLKLQDLRNDFESLKNRDYDLAADDEYKKIAEQTREILQQGRDEDAYDAYTLLRAVVGWHARVAEWSEVFFDDVDPHDNNIHVTWYLKHRNGATSLRIDVSKGYGESDTIAVVNNITTDIPQYSGREILEDYSNVVHQIITAYPKMSSKQQRGAEIVLSNLNARIKGRELTKPVSVTIEEFLTNSGLENLQERFDRLQRLSDTNTTNDLNKLVVDLKELSNDAAKIYIAGPSIDRNGAYRIFMGARELESKLTGQTISFYAADDGEVNMFFTIQYTNNVNYLRIYTKYQSDRMKLFISIKLNNPDDNNQDEFNDDADLVQAIILRYNLSNVPAEKIEMKAVLRNIYFRIRNQEGQLKDLSDKILEILGNDAALLALTAPAVHDHIRRVENPGGIDLNSKGMDLGISKKNGGIQMRFNPSLLAQFRQNDYDGIEANILSIKPIDIKNFLVSDN